MKRHKPNRRTWELLPHSDSAHVVRVIVHSSRATMRRALTAIGHKSDNTEACCWQANKPARDFIIAEMHFGANKLTLDSIAHECAHAAMQWARLLGYHPNSEAFEEQVAIDTGRLTEACILRFRRAGYKLRVKC